MWSLPRQSERAAGENSMVTDRVENVPYRRTELGSQEGARRRAIYAYFGLTFLISWGIEFLLIASENRWGGIALPPAAHYLAAYGPMVAAIVVTGWTAGGAGLKELWGRITRWRVGWGWFLISLVSPAALFFVGAAIAWIVEGKPRGGP